MIRGRVKEGLCLCGLKAGLISAAGREMSSAMGSVSGTGLCISKIGSTSAAGRYSLGIKLIIYIGWQISTP